VTKPDTDFALPMDDHVRILTGTAFRVRNEGERTATVTVDSYRVDRCDAGADRMTTLVEMGSQPDFPIVDKTIEETGLIVRSDLTVAE